MTWCVELYQSYISVLHLHFYYSILSNSKILKNLTHKKIFFIIISLITHLLPYFKHKSFLIICI